MADARGLVLAALGVCTGLLWLAPAVAAFDRQLARGIHTVPAAGALDRAFDRLRILGTKWALIAVLVLVSAFDWRRGILMAAAALIAAGIERGLKLLIQRPRPYLRSGAIELRQGAVPTDASFPSGDAARVWFVVGSMVSGLEPRPTLAWLAVVVAVMVSWGRVRPGAHYPLDVWSGGWLGFGIGCSWGAWAG